MHHLFRELIEKSIANESMADLPEVLRYITELTRSFGCILWQVEPTDEPLARRQLFVLADWFPGGVFCRNHPVPVAASATGRGIVSNEAQHIGDVDREDVHRDPFLIRNAIRAFISQPVTFRDGTRGALNIYRNHPEPFDDQTLAMARELAMMVPVVYDINRHRVGSKLMMDVSAVMQRLEQRPRDRRPFEFAKPYMREICVRVARALHCDEVSIFLEDPQVSPGEYNLAGTTWEDVQVLRRSYRADESAGLTGWSLKHWQVPVRILELREFDDAAIQSKYPGMRWLDSWELRKTVLRRLALDDAEELPFSFMSAPMIHGGVVVGIIRCSVGLGPKYFAADDHRMLQTIATQLAAWWGSLLERRDMEDENQSFQRLAENVVRLNDFVYAELQKPNPESKPILTSALRRTREVIPAAEINDVRLLSEDETELRFAEIDGRAWKEGSAEEVTSRQQRVYKANGVPASVGAHVVQTGQTYIVKDVRHDPYYFLNFPNAKRMIVAPVMLTNRKAKKTRRYGVLDVRTTLDRDFPDYAERIAELLGSQIALYLELADTIRKRNEALRVRDAAVVELQGFHEVEIRFHEEMAHQFRSPINIALMWVREAMRKISEPETLDLLRTVRGACTRAMHVSSNSKLFARLSRGQGIPVSPAKLEDGDLVSMLINTGVDAARLHDHFASPETAPPPPLWSGFRRPEPLPPEKRYSVDTTELEKIRDIVTDRDLFEQTITQILDNAFKYSWPWTVVHVRGGLTQKTKRTLEGADPRAVRRRMRIAVLSQGVPLDRDDAAKVVERGWQAEQAKEFRQAGSGLGMWIVNEILIALGGELQVIPTDDQGWTEIAMIIPIDGER